MSESKQKHKRSRSEGTPLRFMLPQNQLDLLYYAKREAIRREKRGYGMMKSANNNRRPNYGQPTKTTKSSQD